MNTNFLITLGLAFLSFIIPAVSYNLIARNSGVFNRRERLLTSPLFVTAAALFVIMFFSWWLIYSPTDFSGSFNIWQIVIPTIGALLIASSGYHPKIQRYSLLILLASVAAAVSIIPADSLRIVPELSTAYNRLLLFIIWFAFSFIYRYANTGDGVLAAQSITISVGIGILGSLNALPFLLGIFGWAYAAAFTALLIFTWHPSRIKISPTTATAFGFLVFALIAPAVGEGAASCCIILCMFFLIDFLWALVLRLSFIDRYNNIYANTAFQQAVGEGMNPRQACSFSIRLQLLLLFFGCFQAFSPTPWSLSMVAILITLWFLYRFRNIPTPMQSLKDINVQVIDELQDRVNEFKEYVKKDQ